MALSNDESDDIHVAAWPSTVSEAAARVVADLSSAERANLASASDNDLLAEHFGIGMRIRNDFGLWGGNTQLLDACALSGRGAIEQDENHESRIDEAFLFAGRMDIDGASNTILRAARDLARSSPT